MSTNTQQQGRTIFSERDFAFTAKVGADAPWGPLVGDDAQRALNRWEMELQRQLSVGDVTKDASAKAAAMAKGFEDPDVDGGSEIPGGDPTPGV